MRAEFPMTFFKEQRNFCSLKISDMKIYLVSLSGLSSLVILSQLWLPTVQLVLHADWQVLLHSPQPVTFLSEGFAIVFIMALNSFASHFFIL